MAWTRHTGEEIAAQLRQAKILSDQGRLIVDAIRAVGAQRLRTPAGGTNMSA